MTSSTSADTAEALLRGQRVALVGKLAGMSKRDAQQLVRQHGATVIDKPDGATTLVVIGEHESPTTTGPLSTPLDESARDALTRGTLQVIGESQLWQRLGLVDRQQHIHRLYTTGMLAQLLGVGASTVRRWQRRGWLVPVREVRRLAYFDFEEVATARRLNELLAAGMSSAAIEKTLAALRRSLPDVKRPLAQLSITVEGKQLLVRQGDDLVEPSGQLWLDFGEDSASPATADANASVDILSFAVPAEQVPTATPAELVQWAGNLEDEGDLTGAAEMYRAAMAAGGPTAETCFLLAELLYQMHDLQAARERYYMAIELDENYVEARANLGCVLAELDQGELAISAFEGALAFHDDYPDAHYHLGRLLDDLGRRDEAAAHWEAFLRAAPTSPWADEARQRLEG